MKQPCDEAVVWSGSTDALRRTQSGTWLLAATILGSSMAFIDGSVVNVALPALQSSLHATLVDVQWVIESYGLFLSALLLIGGSMGDSVGRRFIFLLGTGVFAGASVGCGPERFHRQLPLELGWYRTFGVFPGTNDLVRSSWGRGRSFSAAPQTSTLRRAAI